VGSQPLLLVDDLTVEYHTLEGRVKAVRDASFQLRKGETLCLVGESGSGKSTIGLTIAGALPENAVVTSGRVLFDGRDLLGLSEEEAKGVRGKSITIIFQDPLASLNPLFTIGELMSDIVRTHLGVTDAERAREIALSALKVVELPDPERVLKSYPHELSGGMLQRAVIAAALSVKPKLLIADEPTTMLDVTLQAQILDLLMNLRERMHLSILFITHNLGIAAEVGDKVIVMYAGKLVEEAPANELVQNPLHPYTKGLLDCVPRAHMKYARLRHIPGTLPDLRNPPPGCPFHERCQAVRSVCKEREPDMVEVSRGHRVACHLYR
jgi:peptide/nickel transport system ATP-binding protein